MTWGDQSWQYTINGFHVQSFYLTEPATHELFDIARKRGLLLQNARDKGAKPLRVQFGGRTFLCRYWRPKKDEESNGYVALDVMGGGRISLSFSDIINKIK